MTDQTFEPLTITRADGPWTERETADGAYEIAGVTAPRAFCVSTNIRPRNVSRRGGQGSRWNVGRFNTLREARVAIAEMRAETERQAAS